MYIRETEYVLVQFQICPKCLVVFTSANQVATIPRALVDEFTAEPITCHKCDQVFYSTAEGSKHLHNEHKISSVPDKSANRTASIARAFFAANKISDSLIKLEIERHEEEAAIVNEESILGFQAKKIK